MGYIKNIMSATCKMNEDTTDRIKGAFLGAVCGDALGGPLEFLAEDLTPALLNDAMRMKGGGELELGPAQPTDDSELAFALLRALTKHDPKKAFPERRVLAGYRRWIASDLFDVGDTCRAAFAMGRPNPDSQSNGALMRVVPVPIWAYGCDDDRIAEHARRDAATSHPHRNCQDCNAIYCVALAYLIKHPGEHAACFGHVQSYVYSRDISADVRRWFEESKRGVRDMEFGRHIGWVRWPFTLAMYHLRKGTSYVKAAKSVLEMLGDVDTNAAIVLGLVGCIHGASGIPAHMKNSVLAFDCTKPGEKGHVRPLIYQTKFNYDALCRYLEGERS